MENDKRTQRRMAAVRTIGLMLAVLLVASCSASSTTIAVAEPQATAVTTENTAGADVATGDPEDGSEDDASGDDASTGPAPTVEPAADTSGAASDDTADGDATTSVPSDDAAVAGNTSVVLLDPGAEPRSELRMMIAATCGEIMTFRQIQEISQSLDGTPLPSSGTIGNVMEMATSASPNGDNYDMRAEVISANAAPGTPPELAAAINPELARLVGLTTFATINDRGVQVPGTVRLEGGEALGPLRETVEAATQTQAPLPVEAVGIGARWETTSVIDVQGLMVVTITESEIVALDGTIVELAVSGSQQVAVGSEMNVQGITAEVTEWTSVTTGEMTVDLATISPISSTAITEATQGFNFGTSGSLMQTLRSEVSVTGEPNDGCTGRTLRP